MSSSDDDNDDDDDTDNEYDDQELLLKFQKTHKQVFEIIKETWGSPMFS
jgi:hypothetical protein